MNERPSSTSEPGGGDARQEVHQSPAWVKAFLLAALLVVVVLFVVLFVGGEHGPARHSPAGALTERFDSQLARPAAVPPTASPWSA